MKKIIKILGSLSIILGIWATLFGMLDDGMALVVGGGLFMALGVTAFAYYKNK